MAPNVDIRIRILGGIQAALQADTVAEAMDQLQDNTDQVARAAVRTTAALKYLQRQLVKTGAAAYGSSIGFRRLGISLTFTSITAWSLASLALPALAIALWNVAAAAAIVTTAFIGGFLGLAAAAGIMAVGVIGRFNQMSGVIGSAANDLQNAGYAVRGAFRDAVGPGADALMSGLAKGLNKLVPLIRSLQGSFTAVGQAFGDGFEHIFTVISTMGPQLREMFARLVPAIRAGADLTASLFQAFVQIATVGAPLLTSAFTWLNRQVQKFTAAFTDGKLSGAVGVLEDFADGVKGLVSAFAKPIHPIFGDAMREFGKQWAKLGPALGSILGQLVAGLMQVGRVALPLVTAGAQWLAQNLPSILGWLGQMGTKLWEAVKPLGPFFANVIWPLIKGLGVGIGFTLGVAIDLIGRVAKALGWIGEKLGPISPAFEVVGAAIGGAFGIALKIVNALLDGLVKVKNLLGDIFKGITGLPGKAWGGLKSLPGSLGLHLPGHAGGGTMTSGGLSWVGERGPEIVNLPRASTVFTAAQSRSIASSDRPARAHAPSMPQVFHQVFQAVLPDGRVLAETVHDWNVGQEALQG